MKQPIIQGTPFSDLPQKGNISPFFQYLIINSVELGFSPYSLRFLGILSLNLKGKQLLTNAKDRSQLSLFDEMTDYSKDSGFSLDFSFKYSDFLPKGNKNYNGIKQAIEELQKKLFSIKFSYVDKKGIERVHELRSQLISGFITDEKQGFKISINAYWYRAIIDLTKRYNSFSKDSLYSLSHNALILYFYLQTLPYIEENKLSEFINLLPEEIGLQHKKYKGTRKKTDELLKLLATNRNLTKNSQIIQRVYEPLRRELATNTDKSFNYKIEKANTSLIVYDVNNIKESDNLQNTSYSLAKIKSSFTYQLDKAKLDETQAFMLIEFYTKYSYECINKATSRKSQLRGQTGSNFIQAFKLLIDIYLSKLKAPELQSNLDDDKKEIRKELITLIKTDTFNIKLSQNK